MQWRWAAGRIACARRCLLVSDAAWHCADRSEHAISPATAVKPVVEQTLIDGVAHNGSTVTLEPRTRDIELRFTAPVLAHAERLRFRYRLDGYDAAWLDAGNRRVARYANLRPGSYLFRVAARNAGGEWNEAAAPVALVLHPYWYQRRSLQLGLGFLLIALSAGAVRWRVVRLQRRSVTWRPSSASGPRRSSVSAMRFAPPHDRLAAATSGIEQAHSQVVGVLNQLGIGALVLEPSGMIGARRIRPAACWRTACRSSADPGPNASPCRKGSARKSWPVSRRRRRRALGSRCR